MYREYVPAPVLSRIKAIFKRTSFYGEFNSYADALAESGIYETDLAYFANRLNLPIQAITWPILGTVLATGRKVLDFGGGLGEIFFQVRPFASELHWRVVDLQDCVEYGARELATEQLSFHTEVGNFIPDVIVLGGVLQYLDQPYAKLLELSRLGAKRIVITRTTVGRERVMIQRVQKAMGGTRHPVTILDEMKLKDCLRNYSVEFEHDYGHEERYLHGFKYMTYVLVRKSPIFA